MPIKECGNIKDGLECTYVSSRDTHFVRREIVFSRKNKRFKLKKKQIEANEEA